MSTPTPPPAKPKASAETLAYEIREIRNQIEEHKRGQRTAGYFLFFGGFALLVGMAVLGASSGIVDVSGPMIIIAYGFTKLFNW